MAEKILAEAIKNRIPICPECGEFLDNVRLLRIEEIKTSGELYFEDGKYTVTWDSAYRSGDIGATCPYCESEVMIKYLKEFIWRKMDPKHGNRERVIAQVTKGDFSGTVVFVKDKGIMLKNIPNRRNRDKKIIEYHDAIRFNDIVNQWREAETITKKNAVIDKLENFLDEIIQPRPEPF